MAGFGPLSEVALGGCEDGPVGARNEGPEATVNKAIPRRGARVRGSRRRQRAHSAGSSLLRELRIGVARVRFIMPVGAASPPILAAACVQAMSRKAFLRQRLYSHSEAETSALRISILDVKVR
jgi:hypothetical protein